MPHICSEEITMIIATIPFIGLFLAKCRTWWQLKFGCSCHNKK